MPWFNRDELQRSLRAGGIGYEPLEQLGGRRRPLPGSPNDGWRVGQFQGYADHMATPEFEAGLERLLTLPAPAAAMCAEARWTSCHRRLLSDALVARGHEVHHILSSGRLERHGLTEFAVVEGGRLTYPAAQASLDLG